MEQKGRPCIMIHKSSHFITFFLLLVLWFTTMGIASCLIMFLVIAYSFRLGIGYGQKTYSVIDFGATGNGETDDSKAFLKAWKTVCGAQILGTTTLRVPLKKTFSLKPLTFNGPCRSNNTQIQIDGTIVAPKALSKWTGCESGSWLHFLNVKGLIISGTGAINGRGYLWWNRNKNVTNPNCKAPKALHLQNCDSLQLKGFSSLNSPNKHIDVRSCHGVTIYNVHIHAPQTSPNTDGIVISGSSKVNIYQSFIGTGDDCIAIKGGSSYINITRVSCGPGHGISVGSLGVGGGNHTVEKVHVRHCTFRGTTNGARIKTWKGGFGYAKAISFERITLVASKNPIVIDQEYSPGQIDHKGEAVKVSDVTYRGFRGTSVTEEAITLNCSELGCSNILMEKIRLTSVQPGQNVTSFCKNAQGKATSTMPHVPCLSY